MRIALIVAGVLWPATLGAALVDRFDEHRSLAGTAVYLAASRICHQKPERSFHSAGHQWPVCARCTGLYLAAPIGAIAAAFASRRVGRTVMLRALAVAAIPTAATWALEVTGASAVSGTVRALAALPLGAAISFAVVSAATAQPRPDKVIG